MLPAKFARPWSASGSTNTLGETSLVLPKGPYELSVSANGFKKWSMRIESEAHLNQVIRAKMALAQQPPQGHLTIKVTDQTGAVISGTQIGILSPPSMAKPVLAVTDANGEVAVDLPPGHYKITGVAQGFRRWVQPVDVKSESNQSVAVTAVVANDGCGVCVTVQEPEIPLEPNDSSIAIPLEPVRNLILPARPYRKKHS